MLLLLTAAVAFYMVILLWLIPEMMEAVPMDTKYWKVKIAASVLFLLPVYAGLLWGAYRCSFLSVRTGTWEEFEKSRLFRRKTGFARVCSNMPGNSSRSRKVPAVIR